MSKEQRQSSKLLEPGSFDVHKNSIVLMIVMLSYLKLDIKVSDANIKTTGSSSCRKVSRDNRNANGVLATI